MIKTSLLLTLLTLEFCGLVNDTPASKAVACMSQLDADVDGVLTFYECSDVMKPLFNELDTNQDSFLNLDELTQYFTFLETQPNSKK